jgi:hypothetical protein
MSSTPIVAVNVNETFLTGVIMTRRNKVILGAGVFAVRCRPATGWCRRAFVQCNATMLNYVTWRLARPDAGHGDAGGQVELLCKADTCRDVRVQPEGARAPGGSVVGQ